MPTRPGLRRMCIVTTGRTGSSLLVDLLDGHPDIRFEQEVLRAAPEWPRIFLRGRAVLAGCRGARAVGFKLTVDQLDIPPAVRDPRLFFDDLVGAGVLLVRLRRRDRLRQAVSAVRAKAIGGFHNRPRDRPQVDPEEVVSTLIWFESHEQKIDELVGERAVADLVYEDALATPDQWPDTVAELCAIVGLTPHRPVTYMQPGAPRELEDMVSNWDEIDRMLRHTRFAHLLDEDRSSR